MDLDQRSLVLLGLLMAQSQHGYQINEFIEHNLSMVTDMKKPTAYATLDKLSKQGYIDVHTEQEGNRPPRKVYTINDSGKSYFYELLKGNLSSAETVKYESDIGLMFMDHLPAETTILALQSKLEQVKQNLFILQQMPLHEEAKSANFAIRHKIRMYEAEIIFIEELLSEMNSI